MADWQAAAREAAQRYGLDPNIFVRQIRQESGFNPNAVSSAGAIGIAQIMPATARGWGVDPHDPTAALDAAASHMASYVKQYGSYRNALIAYNAGPGRVGQSLPSETQHYIDVILNGRDPGATGVAPGSGGSGSTSPAGGVPPSTPPALGAGQGGDFTGLLGQLLHGPAQQPQSTPVAPPSFAAHPALPKAFSAMAPTTSQAPSVQTGATDALGLLETLRGAAPTGGPDGGSGGSDGPQLPPIATSVMNARAGGGTASVGDFTARANAIDARHLSYQWGGGHGAKVDALKDAVPLDCSGAVSAVLGIDPRVSGQFTGWGQAGEGGKDSNVTVYANDHHVLMKIRDPQTGSWHFFGTSATNPGGGAGWIPQTAISRDYLAGFTARHA